MPNVFKKARGTTSPEWVIGPGDIDVLGSEAVAFRTTATGQVEYREAGGAWVTLPSGDMDWQNTSRGVPSSRAHLSSFFAAAAVDWMKRRGAAAPQ